MYLGAPKLVAELAAETDRAELRSVSSVSVPSLAKLVEDTGEDRFGFRTNLLHHISPRTILLEQNSYIANDSSHHLA